MTKSCAARHPSRFSAGDRTPLQLRAQGLLHDLYPHSTDSIAAVEPLFTPAELQARQQAAPAAANAESAAAAARKGTRRKGSSKHKPNALKTKGSAGDGAITAAAAAAAAVAALRASASSPTLLADLAEGDDDLGLMSDLLLPDDPHIMSVLGPGPTAAAAVPKTGPAKPLNNTQQQQQQQQRRPQQEPELVPEMPTVMRGLSGALLLSSPTAGAASSSPDCEVQVILPDDDLPSTAVAAADVVDSDKAAAAAAGVDDIMAVDQILADLAEDGMLVGYHPQQLQQQQQGHPGPLGGSGFSFQALLLSDDAFSGPAGPGPSPFMDGQRASASPAAGHGVNPQLLLPVHSELHGDHGPFGEPGQVTQFDGPMQLQPLMLSEADLLQLQGMQQLPLGSFENSKLQLSSSSTTLLQLSSSSGVDYLTHQQRLFLLRQQEEEQAKAIARAEEKARRREKRRLKKLQKQQQQQQQQLLQAQSAAAGHPDQQPGMTQLGGRVELMLFGGAPNFRPPPDMLPGPPHGQYLYDHIQQQQQQYRPLTHGDNTMVSHTVYSAPGISPDSGMGPAAAAGGVSRHNHPSARYSPYTPPTSSRQMYSSAPGYLDSSRSADPAAAASLPGAASFNGAATVAGSDSAMGTIAAASAGLRMSRSKSSPTLPVLTGVLVSDSEATRLVAVGNNGQQLDVLMGTPVGTGAADAPKQAKTPSAAGAAAAPSVEAAAGPAPGKPTSAAALASPQGASPSGSYSTFNIFSQTHTQQHTLQPLQQQGYQQQQQQLAGNNGRNAATALPHSQAYGAAPAGVPNPWLHRTVSTVSSDTAHQQQPMLSPQGSSGLIHGMLSASEATLLAASTAVGTPAHIPPQPFSPTAASKQQQQQQQQQQTNGVKRRGRGRSGQVSGGGVPFLEVNGGMDLAASSRLLRTSSGKVLRMLTHPVTGKPLLLGPAVDAKTSRLGNTSLGAPAPQLFGHILQTNKVPPASTPTQQHAPEQPPPYTAPGADAGYDAYPAYGTPDQLQLMGYQQHTITTGDGFAAVGWDASASAAAAAAAGGGIGSLGAYSGGTELPHPMHFALAAETQAQLQAQAQADAYAGLVSGQGDGGYATGQEGQGWGRETGVAGEGADVQFASQEAGVPGYVDDGLMG